MLLPRLGIIYHQRPKGKELIARSLSLFLIITLQNDILFKLFGRGVGNLISYIL